VFSIRFLAFYQYKKSENGSEKKREILKQITETKRHRDHLDGSMDLIGTFLYGPQSGSFILNTVRESGMPLVDDWGCLKSTVITDSAFDFVMLFWLLSPLTHSKTWLGLRFGYSKHIVGL
jgi:hypothetical protein